MSRTAATLEKRLAQVQAARVVDDDAVPPDLASADLEHWPKLRMALIRSLLHADYATLIWVWQALWDIPVLRHLRTAGLIYEPRHKETDEEYRRAGAAVRKMSGMTPAPGDEQYVNLAPTLAGITGHRLTMLRRVAEMSESEAHILDVMTEVPGWSSTACAWEGDAGHVQKLLRVLEFARRRVLGEQEP